MAQIIQACIGRPIFRDGRLDGISHFGNFGHGTYYGLCTIDLLNAACDSFSNPRVREDKTITLEHGKPMIFGKDRDRGIRLEGTTPMVVTLGDGVTEDDGHPRYRGVDSMNAVAKAMAGRQRHGVRKADIRSALHGPAGGYSP
mgnify:CR=1 FL=1